MRDHLNTQSATTEVVFNACPKHTSLTSKFAIKIPCETSITEERNYRCTEVYITQINVVRATLQWIVISS